MVQGALLHTGDVIVHQEELAEVGQRVEPGGGDHLEEVVTQGEGGEAGQAGQGGGAQCEDPVVGQVQSLQ